jgi:hypothetical protein
LSGVAFNQRVFVAGQTRSGKSEILNYLFSSIRCQRVLLDTKGGEWEIPGVEPATDVGSIDWRQPTIHVVTQTTGTDEIAELFNAFYGRRSPLTVCCHELGDLCGFNANATPAAVDNYISKGGAWGKGLFGGSQRPRQMPTRMKTEVQHVFITTPPMSAADMREIEDMGLPVDRGQLAPMVKQLGVEHGEYAFLHLPKGAHLEPVAWAPLPEHLRAAIVVKRAPGVS